MDKELTLQSLLSKLVTNPRCLMRALGSPLSFVEEIRLNPTDKILLVDFLNENCHKFLASALFLFRKRFLSVLETLHLIEKIYSIDELDIFWTKYMATFKLYDNPPKNPMYESLTFCKYVLAREELDEIEKLIFQYEIYRNEICLQYNTYQDDKHTLVSRNSLSTNLFIHPCSQIIVFNGNISDIIKSCVNNKISLEKASIIYKKCEEYILFFKNFKIGKMTTIKISELHKLIIETIQASKDLKKAFRIMHAKYNIDYEQFKKVALQLVSIGLALPTHQHNGEIVNV